MGAKGEMVGCYEKLMGNVYKGTVVSVVMIYTMKGSCFFDGMHKSELLFVKEKEEWERIWISDACFLNGDQSIIKSFCPTKISVWLKNIQDAKWKVVEKLSEHLGIIIMQLDLDGSQCLI